MDPRLVTVIVVAAACVAFVAWRVRPLPRRWRQSGDASRGVASGAGPLAPIDDALMAGMGRRGASEGTAGDRASEVRTASSATPPVDMVLAWADGRTCVWCGSALTESRLAGHHIALLEPGGMTRQWVDVPEAQLPLALATCLPLCWNCDLAATFRRLHPELVTDRDERSPHDRGH